MSRIAGVYYNDTANAEGVCISVYLSGCDIKCPGCHNQELQDFSYGELFTSERAAEICSHLMDNNVKRNLCILGGEPLHDKNISATNLLARMAKDIGVKVYIWTGYFVEDLLVRAQKNVALKELLFNGICDVIIDGPYVESLRDITLSMRGSSNQRVIETKDLTLK